MALLFAVPDRAHAFRSRYLARALVPSAAIILLARQITSAIAAMMSDQKCVVENL